MYLFGDGETHLVLATNCLYNWFLLFALLKISHSAFCPNSRIHGIQEAQYFVWFFCLLPIILPWCKMKMKWKGIGCLFAWMGAPMHWHMWGYLLEFKGKNIFLQLWQASLVFLAANTFVSITIIRYHEMCSIFIRQEQHAYQDIKKLE